MVHSKAAHCILKQHRSRVYYFMILDHVPCASATVLHIDNQSAIKIVKNPVFHRRTKHIEIQYNFIREKYENKTIDVDYIPSELQLADVFTRALARDAHKRLCAKIGLCCLDVSTLL